MVDKVFQLQLFSDLDGLDLYRIMQLRSAVFVLEQNCAYQDLDGLDLDALHLFKKIDHDEVVAYARIILPEQGDNKHCSIGRVVVKQNQRQNNLGHQLMQAAIQAAIKHCPNHPIKISAQTHLTHFYQRLGFINTGKFYTEDQIPHQQMVYQPSHTTDN